MDLVPSLVWLSSIAGAALFYSGGRLWGRATSKEEAEQDSVRARRAREDAVRAAEAEKARAAELAAALMAAGVELEDLRLQIDAERARAAAEHARADAEQARADAEGGALQRELDEHRRGAAGLMSLAETQRRHLELTLRTRVVEQREREIERREAEHEALVREAAALAAQAAEVDGLRRRLRDLEALELAQPARPSGCAPVPPRPGSRTELETAIAECLDDLLGANGCRTAVVADMRGLLVASAGECEDHDRLAAAVAAATETADRLRQILPLGDPLEIRLTDVNGVALTARWVRCDEDDLLLGTLGVAEAGLDAPAVVAAASITDLLGAPVSATRRTGPDLSGASPHAGEA